MNLLSGFGWYVWMISECGETAEIAAMARVNGCAHLMPKIADGVYPYNVVSGVDLAKRLTTALQALGIVSWGWQYAYLRNPIAEADMAVKRIRETGVTGFVIDAEAEWNNNGANAEIYCKRLRAQLGDSFPIALSSYRYPSVHPEFPWAKVRAYVNMDMPQVYWEQAHNPGYQLNKSFKEFQAMTPKLPYLPTGAAYQVSSWEPTVDDIKAFQLTAANLKLCGYNFWSWQNCKRDVLPVWEYLMDNPIGPVLLPDYVIVKSAGDILRIRKTSMGEIVGTVPQGVCLKVFEQTTYLGKLWYRVGAGRWVVGEYVEMVL